VDPAIERELAQVLATARALVSELAEEGVERFEPLPPESNATPAAPPPPMVPPQPVTPAAVTPTAAQPDLLGEKPVWGDAPSLDQVREALGECTRCRLSQGRNLIVFGDGDPNADLLFVGEGPGAEEDRQGVPFVGRAGELLTQMIEKGLGLARSQVYICNIVKCRPPKNRAPLGDEAATCRPYLDGQIAAVRPRVIVALGKPASSLLFGRDVAITRVRGTWHEYRGIPVMPTFHPAFILRQYTPENRRLVWEDLKAALARSRDATPQ